MRKEAGPIAQDTRPTQDKIDQFINLLRCGRYAEAAYLAKSFTGQFPGFGIGWKMLGTSILLQGRQEEALPPLLQAAALLPEDPDLHANLGLVFYELARFDSSEKHCRLALRIRPNHAIGHNNLGNTLQAMERLGEAEMSFRSAIEINPNMAEAHYNLGRVLLSVHRVEEAESCFRRAFELKPDYSQAYESLGDLLKDSGYYAEALKNWDLSLRYKESWQEALKNLTSPLLVDSDLVCDRQYPTASFTEDQVLSLKDTMQLPVDPEQAKEQERKYLVSSDDEATFSQNIESGPSARNSKKLRIVLIYPPLWQNSSPELQVHEGMPFGPPPLNSGRLAVDDTLKVVSQGLLSIAAQAKHAGYHVSVYNLFDAPWADIVSLISRTKADVYGVSAYTANRRGMGALCALIRKHHPHAHITVGGPFATSLPAETLHYYRDIDTVVIGEGEETFMELLERIATNTSTCDISGTAWRKGEEVTIAPRREPVKNLDNLAPIADHYVSNIIMTSRGCPSKCSFCANPVLWGRKVRYHSVEACLGTFEKVLAKLPVPFLMIADDTFTANQKRTIDICDTILKKNLNFIWNCNSRVDTMDDEVLYKMRLAGCQEIMIGVESGSQEILDRMHKGTTPEMVLAVTNSAKKYGMLVHYYLIIVNRGETPNNLQDSINLIKTGRPNTYDLTPLMFLPGTEDFDLVCERQGFTTDAFFRNDFLDLSVGRKREKELKTILQYAHCSIGSINGFDYTIQEREAVLNHLPNLHVAHLELAQAYLCAGLLDKARVALSRSEELCFPIGNIVLNLHACISVAQNKVEDAVEYLEKACRSYPDSVVKYNYDKLTDWIHGRAEGNDRPCLLNNSVRAQDYQ